jgi:hypothetical protein
MGAGGNTGHGTIYTFIYIYFIILEYFIVFVGSSKYPQTFSSVMRV